MKHFFKPLRHVASFLGIVGLLLVTVSLARGQYCTPVHSTPGDYISSFSTSNAASGNVNLSHDTPPTGEYEDLSGTTITQTQNVNLDFAYTYDSGGNTIRIWVDKDNDGNFDASEIVHESYSAGGGTIDLSGIGVGTYRMRIRTFWSTSQVSFNACETVGLGYGYTIDYTLAIVAQTPCATTPDLTSTTVTVSLSTANAGTSYTVTANPTPTESGLTFQWQSSPNGNDSWTDEGTSSSTYAPLTATAPTGVGTKVYYRLKVTCTAGGSDAFTTNEAVFETGKIYCTPIFTTSLTDDNIKDVITTGANTNLNNLNTGHGANGSGYSDYTAQQLEIVANQLVSLTVNTGGDDDYLSIWVDKNDNGTFELDLGERVFINNTRSATHTTPNNFLFGIAPGTYRMRIISHYSATDDPCVSASWGEAEDYTLVVVTGTPCATTPDLSGSTVAVTPTSAGAGESYIVTATTPPTESGLTFQWQSSPNGNDSWTDVGSSSSTYAPLTATAPTGLGTKLYYHLKVTCSAGGSDAFTTNEAVFETEYCTPTTTNTGDRTSLFQTINGITKNINYSTTAYEGAYINKSADANNGLVTAIAGQTITFDHTYVGGNHNVRIWVDWDSDGVFDDSEEVFYEWSDNLAITNKSFSVPSGTPLNTYRMRVRSQYQFSDPGAGGNLALIPCGNLAYGSTVDFTLQIVTPPSCLPPTALTLTQTSLTSGDLSWTVNGGNVASYDVEWGTTGFALGSGTPINGLATTSTSITTVTDVDYEFYVRQDCGTDGTSDWAGPYAFKTGYCTPSFGTGAGFGHINEFSTTGAVSDITNNTNAQSAGGYGDFTGSHIIQAITNATVNFSATLATTLGSGFAIWIDWNQDGVFAPSERVFHTTAKVLTPTGTFTVGGSAGTYRMRVMSDYDLGEPVDPCKNATTGGEIEDYTIVVNAGTPCSTTLDLSSTTATVTPSTANAGTSYTVTVTSIPTESGLTFQWQTSPNGNDSWTDEGTSSSSYAPLTATAPTVVGTKIYYRLKVTCSAGGSDAFTTNEAVFETGLIYCTPTFSTQSFSAYIKDVITTGGLANLNNTNTSYGTNGSGFSDYTAQQFIIAQGATVGFTVNTGGDSEYLNVWVDLNGNGTFEATENIVSTSSSATTHSVQNISTTLVPMGTYRMRVMTSFSSTTNPCVSASWGEAEDYTLVVIVQTPCSTTPDLSGTTVTVTPNSSGAGESYTVTASSTPTESGLTFQWQTSPNGNDSWTDEGTSSSSYAPLTATAPTVFGTKVYYRLKVTCSAGGSDAFTTNEAVFETGYCTPTHTSNNDYITSFITTDAASGNVGYSAGSAPAGKYENLSATTITQVEGVDINFTRTHTLPSHTLRIWVDWNNDGVFDNVAPELVYSGLSGDPDAPGVMDLSSSTPGTYRMRIRSGWGTTIQTFDACENPNSGYGSTIDYTLKIDAVPPCTDNAGTIAGDVSACEDATTITLTTNGDTGGTWSSTNNAVATVVNGTVTIVGDGTTDITYKVGTGSCETTSAPHTITIHPLPTVTLDPNTANICLGDNVTLTASGAGTTASSYAWSGGDLSGDGLTKEVSPSADASYTVTGTDANGCKNTASSSVTVTSPITNVSITGVETLAVDSTELYVGSPAGGTWTDFDDETASFTNGALTAKKAGTVTLVYEVTNPAPCTGSVSETKTVTITASGTNIGVNDIDFVSSVSLFPNPANNEVNVEFTLQHIADIIIELVDLNGKVIKTQSLTNVVIGTNTSQLNINDCANGVYSLLIRSNDSVTTQKLVVTK